LKRGVKQGDPLSPFIFNAIVDPLLEQLKLLKGYRTDDRYSISSLAFADDLLLLAATREDVQQQLLHTERYLHSLGVKVAAAKCASFEIRTTRHSWFIADPDLQLGGGAHITSSTADSTHTYLGAYTSPWNGLQHKDLGITLKGTLQRLRSASL
jgi:hypothetical protein